MTEAEQDKMLIIKILHEKMNWSFRRIGRLFDQSKNTVKDLYSNALEEKTAQELTNLPKGRRGIDLRYVGDTSDVEYLEGHINHNVCGGGRRIDQTTRDDN